QFNGSICTNFNEKRTIPNKLTLPIYQNHLKNTVIINFIIGEIERENARKNREKARKGRKNIYEKRKNIEEKK
ncbi:MAG: hypothetical protein LBL39_03610, partial [Planctomycetaceae bacterium]|nr:hypothetical protein [Planctomycetaceae bacterium]